MTKSSSCGVTCAKNLTWRGILINGKSFEVLIKNPRDNGVRRAASDGSSSTLSRRLCHVALNGISGLPQERKKSMDASKGLDSIRGRG
jgi:hypothetical protein